MAQQLDARLREHLRARNNLLTEGTPGLSASLSRPLLCLFDRNFELSVVRHLSCPIEVFHLLWATKPRALQGASDVDDGHVVLPTGGCIYVQPLVWPLLCSFDRIFNCPWCAALLLSLHARPGQGVVYLIRSSTPCPGTPRHPKVCGISILPCIVYVQMLVLPASLDILFKLKTHKALLDLCLRTHQFQLHNCQLHTSTGPRNAAASCAARANILVEISA